MAAPSRPHSWQRTDRPSAGDGSAAPTSAAGTGSGRRLTCGCTGARAPEFDRFLQVGCAGPVNLIVGRKLDRSEARLQRWGRRDGAPGAHEAVVAQGRTGLPVARSWSWRAVVVWSARSAGRTCGAHRRTALARDGGVSRAGRRWACRTARVSRTCGIARGDGGRWRCGWRGQRVAAQAGARR